MSQNQYLFEQAILFLLAFVAVYFIHLAIRDYRTSVNIRRLSGKVRELITGKYTEDIIIEKDRDLAELAGQLNDLSTVFRLAQENLAQEKNLKLPEYAISHKNNSLSHKRKTYFEKTYQENMNKEYFTRENIINNNRALELSNNFNNSDVQKNNKRNLEL